MLTVRPARMSLRQSLHERVAWSDLLSVGLMSLAAPWIAAYMHSSFVFRRGIRLYNAEAGGAFLGDSGFGPRIVIEAWHDGEDQKWDLVEIHPRTLTL